MQTIKIKYHTDIEKIKTFAIGDMIDLRSAETVVLKKGDYKLISLGVSMQLPEGYFAKLYPRSSTYKNFKIISANAVGIIDNSYCGDNDIWRFPAIALENTVIRKGDRICQFELCPIQPIEFVVTEKLDNADRGGIGSTGVK